MGELDSRKEGVHGGFMMVGGKRKLCAARGRAAVFESARVQGLLSTALFSRSLGLDKMLQSSRWTIQSTHLGVRLVARDGICRLRWYLSKWI